MKQRCGRIYFAVGLAIALALLSHVEDLAKNNAGMGDSSSSYHPNIWRVRNNDPCNDKDAPSNAHDKPSSDNRDDKSSNNATVAHDTTSSTQNEWSALVPSYDTSLPSTEKLDLDDIVDPKSLQIKVDVSDVIDFAIVGNPKTGTTFMADWMRTHPDLLL